MQEQENYNGEVVEEAAESRVQEVDIRKEMHNSFLSYSMSVIVSRALPDVRDGLKPVHRRILYTMYENSLHADKPYRKCADTVGAVLGRYHPHGDASVYDALVRLAQDFSMRYPLVDGHGNFGSVDGDPPAAYRYTEARMCKLTEVMMEDIDKKTVDFQNNYDDRLQEPLVLPCHFPNLLVNGSTGIAVGMATNIPPHNMSEVIDGVCAFIDNPNLTLEGAMEHIKGPDFPTAGMIMGRSGIRAAYGTGRGKITVRARTEIVEEKNGRYKIAITELPYQVNKARLHESIADLVKEKRIDGISGVEDHSDRNGMYLVVDVKRDASPQVVLNQLFRFTQMQVTYGIIQLAIVDGQPKLLTLLDILREYVDFQKDVVTRRVQFDLKKAEDRAHILEGLKIALDYIDEVVAMLRAAKSIAEGKAALMERFGLTDVQATAIVQMQLGRLTGLERQKIEEELEALLVKIDDYRDILKHEWRVLAIIKDELLAMKAKFGDERRTEIAAITGEVDIEDLIPEEDCVLTLTNFGYVKRQTADTYHTQKRGGKGVTALKRREEDVAKEMFVCSSHDHVLFFSNDGKVYKLKCYEVAEGSRQSRGTNIANLLPIVGEEKITTMLHVSDFEEDKYLVMVTKQGYIKRTPLSAFQNLRKGGLIALTLEEGDELCWVTLTDGREELLLGTKLGYAIRFAETDVRSMGRTARGVRALKLREGDEVVGLCRNEAGKLLLTVSETGFGRLSPWEEYRLQSRGGMGIRNYYPEKYGMVSSIRMVHPQEDDLICISSDGTIIRIEASSIPTHSRTGKGVKVMRVDGTEENKVVAVATAPHDDEEVDAMPEQEEEIAEEILPEDEA